MASIVDQTKSLAGSIMSEEVPALRSAVSEAVTNKDARQSAITEIWSTIKTIWAKVMESGIIASLFAQLKALFSKLTARSGDEGTPLLDSNGTPRSAGNMIGGLASMLPESVRSVIPGALLSTATQDQEAPPAAAVTAADDAVQKVAAVAKEPVAA